MSKSITRLLNKQNENIVERLREHGYKCDVSTEGVIVHCRIESLGTHIDHDLQGIDLTRSLRAVLHGIGQSNVRQASVAAERALKRVEDFVKDHNRYKENVDLMYAVNHIVSALEKTTSNVKDIEAMKYIVEEEEDQHG